MRIFLSTILLVLSSALYAQTTNISALGPEGGIVTLLKGKPDESVVLAVVLDTNLYRSVNGGEWEKVTLPPFQSSPQGNQFFNRLSIFDIAFHPLSDTVLMATSMGLLRSVDAGTSWSQLFNFPFPRFCIRYAPGNPSLIFGSDEQGVLLSTDGGGTWQPRKDDVFGNRSIRRLAIHPADADLQNLRLVATTEFHDPDPTEIFFTSDGGFSWKPMVKGLPTGDARRIYSAEIDSIGFGKSDFRVIIGTADGIYGTQTDPPADTAWSKINGVSGVITGGILVFDSTGGLRGFNCYIASNGSEYDGKPTNYSAANGLIKIDSREGGLFSPFNPPVPHRVFKELTDITSIFIPVQKDKKKIYLGTTAGIVISTDAGTSWQTKNSGLFHTIIRNLASTNEGLFAAIYGAGVYRSDDDGKTWVPSNTGLTNPYVTTVMADHKRNILYAGTKYTVYRSGDGGKLWNGVDPSNFPSLGVDTNAYATRDNDMTIRISPKNPDLVMMHSRLHGLNISADGGQSWNPKQLPPVLDTIHVPENIEFDPIDSLTIYFSGFGLFKSPNLGELWTDISSNIPKYLTGTFGQINIQTLSPTINPKNNQEIFLASVFDRQEGFPFRLWKTTDGGGTWDTLNQLLPVYDVQYDKFDTQRLLAAGPGGIFATTNSGLSWSLLSDQQSPFIRYFLLSAHASNPNVFYLGSEQGAYRIEINERSQLTVDAMDYNFGSLLVGKDSVQTIYLRNTNGQRNVVVRLTGRADTTSFQYFGKEEYDIPAERDTSFDIKFSPRSGGFKIGVLRFLTSDQNLDTVQFVLKGHAYFRNTIEKFTYDFGSVTVGKDTTITIEIDNQFGFDPVTFNYVSNSDTTSFSYLGNNAVVIDTGKIAPLAVRFSPKTTGTKQAYLRFTSTDPRFPGIVFRLQGTGIARNFLSRRVLLDTSINFRSYDGSTLAQYYKLLTLSLERADIKVDYKKEAGHSYAEYNALVFVLPDGTPPQEMIDSLTLYVLSGGTVVALGDFGERNVLPFNTFLHDTTWAKYNVKTGIRFNTDLIADATIRDTALAGISIAYPAKRNAITYNVDSVVLFTSGSVSIDTTVQNALPLLLAKSPLLVSINPADSVITPVLGREKLVAASSLVGKGKIIAIADYDIWWNGMVDDTTKSFGIFAANNLRLALNIFGLVDNLAAQLPERTPQESFKLISIPYSFADSSVLSLFKDLGPPNEYVWRMFGKWKDSIGYAEFPRDFKNIRRGEGYWLITREPKEISFGTTTVQGSESDFEITLHPGYNMIGNPFPYRVSWAASVLEDSIERVLWKYDKDFDTTSLYMEPFEGYFIKNRGAMPKVIKISSMQVTSTSSLGKELTASYPYGPMEWKLQLVAQTPHATDERNFIGMLKNSTDGIDDEDFSEPPTAPSNYVSLSLKANRERLAADYRSVSGEGQYWDVEITSSKPKTPVTLTLNKFGNLSNDFKVYFLDKTEERVIDVTTSLSHLFVFGKKEYSRQLRLLVGTQSFVENNTGGIPLVPLQYSLDQNFPNPFNPTTTIRYSLSHSANVKLEIFNILGQKIRTLVHQFQPIGVYTTQWDGADDLQKKVASGFYYYRLQANEFANVKKMTLIK